MKLYHYSSFGRTSFVAVAKENRSGEAICEECYKRSPIRCSIEVFIPAGVSRFLAKRGERHPFQFLAESLPVEGLPRVWR